MALKKPPESSTQIQANLRWLLKQSQLSQNQLARLTKVNQPIIHRILSGQNVSPREKTVASLAKHFSLSSDDLLYKNLSDQSSLPQHLRGYRIPIFKQQEARISEQRPEHWPLSITVYYQVSNEAFAVIVDDDAMKPEINAGDLIVIEPKMTPTGEIVLACLKRENLVVVRQYKAISYKKGILHFVLKATEESNFPSFDSEENASNIDVLGVVVARWEKKIKR
jgi:transcriptional regulator with XRE-family HTH domain